jgi:hypothetical protein
MKESRGQKKIGGNDTEKLTAAEKRRYESIMTIQKYLAEGYTATTICGLLHTSYFRIRRYAKGDPYQMCRFEFNGGSRTNTPRYREQIIELPGQNLPVKAIHGQMAEPGCNAKLTSFKDYCRKLVAELGMEYNPKLQSALSKLSEKSDRKIAQFWM